MKLTFIPLLILCGFSQAQASTILVNTDFRTVTELPTHWTAGAWRSSSAPHYQFDSANGATVNNSWKQTHLDYSSSDFSLSSANKAPYSISFSTYASDKDQQSLFYLSSENYSIVIGNSYNGNASYIGNHEVAVGTLSKSIGDAFISFQTGTGTNPAVIGAHSESSIDVSVPLDYTLTLSSGLLQMSVTDGTNTFSSDYTIASDFSFDKIGFIHDGNSGTTGVKNISISTASIPEPSTTSLSLLALAGLMFRRRRSL